MNCWKFALVVLFCNVGCGGQFSPLSYYATKTEVDLVRKEVDIHNKLLAEHQVCLAEVTKVNKMQDAGIVGLRKDVDAERVAVRNALGNIMNDTASAGTLQAMVAQVKAENERKAAGLQGGVPVPQDLGPSPSVPAAPAPSSTLGPKPYEEPIRQVAHYQQPSQFAVERSGCWMKVRNLATGQCYLWQWPLGYPQQATLSMYACCNRCGKYHLLIPAQIPGPGFPTPW